MSELWPTLGYDQTAAAIADALHAGTSLVVIDGPPGVGKSYLAQGIGGLWQEAGASSIVAEGDDWSSDVELYPFASAMAGLPGGVRSVGDALAGVARAGEAAVGTFGIITSTVEAIAKLRRERRRGRAILLGDAEQDILARLDRLARGKPILLIADNLHWWDAKSLALLARLRDPRVWTAFPFLAELRVLAVQTPEPYQTAVCPEAHERLLGRGATRRFTLERIPRAGFAEVLVALGAPSRPAAEAAELVHELSGGNLALASKCATRLARGDTDVLAATDSAEFVHGLLTDRIYALGALGKQAIAVLQIAAVLGLTFRRDELTCAARIDTSETARILRHCSDEALVRLLNGAVSFVHDRYRQHFLDIDADERIAIHERLSDCLRDQRPGDYDVRCLNALRAERRDEAAGFAVQAVLAAERDGRPWRELPSALVGAIADQGWTSVVELFTEAHQHLNLYRFAECLAALDSLPRDLPETLRAEADYLRASCRMSTRSEDERAIGRAILRSWDGYEHTEPELGVRLMRLLLYGLSHTVDKGPAIELEGQIQAALGKRVRSDTAARDAAYTLDRIAGSIYVPEVAFVRNREAAEYFGPQPGHTFLRRPVEYYRCLVNRGASEIAITEYRTACATYAEVERLVESYAEGVFPRLDWPRTNALGAEYRLGAVQPDEAVRRQRATIERCKTESDPFYVENALGVFLALADRPEEAIDVFDRLHEELMRSRRSPEASTVYLIRANRCATRFVSGYVGAAQEEWVALTELVERIPYSIRPYLVRRHERLAEVIAAGRAMSPREFDEYLVVHGPMEFGPLWNNYGHGFRLPEIEFWRDN